MTRWPVLVLVALLATIVALALAGGDGGGDSDSPPPRAAPAFLDKALGAQRAVAPRRSSSSSSGGRSGIPVGGIFTGLDNCYHRRCDTLRNVDREVVALSARATERALVDLAGR